jgi:hypothetical protein
MGGSVTRRTPMRRTVAMFMFLGIFAPLRAWCSDLPPAQSFLPIPEARFSSENYLILRGRMRECMIWDGRILEVHDLSKSTIVNPLGLREVDVANKSVLEVYNLVRNLLDETFIFEETPLVTVEMSSVFSMAYLEGEEFLQSRDAIRRGSCPAKPPKAPSWWPRGPEDRKEKPYAPTPPPDLFPTADPLYSRLAVLNPRVLTPSAV